MIWALLQAAATQSQQDLKLEDESELEDDLLLPRDIDFEMFIEEPDKHDHAQPDNASRLEQPVAAEHVQIDNDYMFIHPLHSLRHYNIIEVK